MSVHLIYYQQGHKMMEAVATEETYRRYRDSQTQARLMEAIRHPKPETDVSAAKRKLVQFNYSCLPTEDGGLKGAKRLSKSVGMDIDHLSADEVELVAATAIDKKDELGLLMLERSARGGGLHLVFRRHPEMDQEANLRWASDLLGVEYDAGAKDITRVFFATTSEDLLYLHEDLFDNAECESFTGSEATFTGSEATFTNKEAAFAGSEATFTNKEAAFAGSEATFTNGEAASTASEATSETEADQAQPAAATAPETTAASRPANHPLEAGEDAKEQKDEKGEKTASEEKPLCYKGIPYDRIIEKWWAFYNEGEHPIRSNRNTLTFELAVNLRHICDSDPQLLDRIIPCYDGFPEAEKMACIRSALGEKMTQMPRRLEGRADGRAPGHEGRAQGGGRRGDHHAGRPPILRRAAQDATGREGEHQRRGPASRHARHLRHHAGHRHARHGRARVDPRQALAAQPHQLHRRRLRLGQGQSRPHRGGLARGGENGGQGLLGGGGGMARTQAGGQEQEGAARGPEVSRALPDSQHHRGQPGRPSGQHPGQARLLLHARGRHRGAEMAHGDERLLRHAAPGLRRHALRPRGEVGRGRQRAYRQTAVERRDVWHARRALPRHHQLHGRISEPCGPGTHARQHLLAALGEPLLAHREPTNEDPAGGPSVAPDEWRR